MKSKIKSLKLQIASPEQIRSWSNGEVRKSETINYKTFKPEKGGLFDEAIFGPIKDYECACGKYKKIKYKGKVCERCGVEVTESIVRRERMGHIELAAPVAHIWMSKELPSPSKISLILDIPYKQVEEVIYFVNHIVLNSNGNEYLKDKDIIDLTNPKTSIADRRKLINILKSLKIKFTSDSIDAKRCNEYINALKIGSMPFSIEQLFNFVKKHTGIVIGIGAEAIHQLLKNVDLNKEKNSIQKDLLRLDPQSPRFRKQAKRLEVYRWFIESNNKPEWMIMQVLPVTPPDTRPIIQLDGGRFTTSDINNFYRKIIIRNDRLRKMIDQQVPSIILNNEKRMLQEAVDALFDNSSRTKPTMSKDKRPLKSLTDHLKGKQGLFRQNLLGKRVDYSGRSVIVVGPELKMYEVGIPSLMVLKLFRPFIIRELIKKYDEYGNEIKPLASTIKIAEKMILKQDDEIWPIVNRIITERPVLLNRAPTLHRLGIQAFEPRIVDGKAIRLHPLVCTAFNADFDGDQMAVHVPLSIEACAEARDILLASWHILGPKDGKPIITPTQDMILGIYYLTTVVNDGKGAGMIFGSKEEALKAYTLNQVHPHSIIGISTSVYSSKKFPCKGTLITTVGKIIMNDVLPEDMVYINNGKEVGELNKDDIVPIGENVREKISKWQPRPSFTKKSLQNIISLLFDSKNIDGSMRWPVDVIAKTMDGIKNLGFRFSTKSAISISAYDIPDYENKYEYFKDADVKVQELKKFYSKGLITDDEKYLKTVQLWTNVKDQVSNDVEKIMQKQENQSNSIIVMAKSGARGNLSQFTQLMGMRGLMSKSFNYDQKSESRVIKDTIEIPIKHSFVEGLSISEYFNSSYGARKGMADTAMKTSKSGYMTRKLVDAAQDVTVTEDDCGTTRGLIVEAIYDTKDGGKPIESLADRIANRYAMEDIVNPKNKDVLVAKNEIITTEMAEYIEKIGIKQVEIRSVLHCQAKNGICKKCFGNDLSTKKPIEIGTAIGVIAAQSIGEPGTQLTMRTFHTGGAAGGSNIAQGFERLKQLFDVVPPKSWELATISDIDGTIRGIVLEDNCYRVEISNKYQNETKTYKVPFNSTFRVSVDDEIKAGDKITEGSIDMNQLLKISGIAAVRNYLIKEVQKVYRMQGIEIADKYIEVMLRQMTNKVRILNVGDSSFFIGQIIDIDTIKKVNNELLLDNKTPTTFVNAIFGVESVPSKSNSFLSAASFQDTKKILTDACVKSEPDMLSDLKSNVMLGNLIPVGTGLEEKIKLLENGQKMYKKEY
ncbi:MAG: DNA-directed RNA polymerase subunit beta' [Mycoplasmataceae bacterium]|nr:DNA-directed RNA polymerase subunit beta' [Mycoplasmataceae bacterium]